MHPGKAWAASIPRSRQRGFTYFIMLFALAIFGVGLATLGETWSTVSQRDKEDELIRVGDAYVRAIREYYLRSPGTPKTYPMRLDELLEDRRFVGIERHLRRVYLDPITNSVDWGLVRAPDGGIAGVYSLSEKVPLRRQPLILANAATISGERYTDWKFVYRPAP